MVERLNPLLKRKTANTTKYSVPSQHQLRTWNAMYQAIQQPQNNDVP